MDTCNGFLVRSTSFLMWPPLVYLALVTTCTIWQTDVLAENYNVTALIEEFKNIKNCVYTKSVKKDQCANRTERYMMSPAFFDADMFRYSFCYCDPECHVFRDCCADVADFSNIDESQRRIAAVPSTMWSCAAINIKRNNPNKLLIYMVTKCPEGHKYSGYCSRLSYPVDNTLNYMLDIARMDQESGVWYQNVYCALCHGVANHLAPINATLVCSRDYMIEEDSIRELLPNAIYQRENLAWEWQENENETFNCTLQVTPEQWRQDKIPREMTEFLPGVYRPCIALTDSCPSDWTDQDVAHKCYSFANYIMRILQDVYKNHYCALCNSVPVDKFMCWQPLPMRSPPIQPKIRINAMNLPSLSMVMEFDWNFKGEESWNENSKLCSPPYGIYDAIHKRCQPLDDICNKGYKFINNQCIYTETNNDSNINASCPRVKLVENQYELLPNGSLKLDFESSDYHNRVFDAGFFGILIDGTAWVCMIFEKSSLIFSERAEGILTVICLSISIICICLHIIAYSLISKLRNLPGKNLLALSCALLFAQLVFLLGVHPVVKVSRGVCRTIAMLIHYFFLASFFWMNVMGFDIWRKFRKAMHGLSPIRLHRKYAVYAWGTPALIILLSMLMDLKEILPQFARPNYARPNVKSGEIIYDNCWFGSPLGLGIFLALPVIIILIVNMFFFTTTVRKIIQQKKESTSYIKNKNREELLQAKSRNSVLGEVKNVEKSPIKTLSGDKDQIRLYLYVKLFTIMGLTWIFGFVAALAYVPILWYPFIISNGLQGAFIFVMFDCKRTIASAIWEKVFGKKYQIPEFLKTPKRSENSKSDTTNSISLTTRLRNMSNHRSSTIDTSRNSTVDTSHEVDHDVTGRPDSQQTVRIRLGKQPVDGVDEKYRSFESEEELINLKSKPINKA